jgi:hypothetical protein
MGEWGTGSDHIEKGTGFIMPGGIFGLTALDENRATRQCHLLDEVYSPINYGVEGGV